MSFSEWTLLGGKEVSGWSTVIPRPALREYERGDGRIPTERAPSETKVYAMMMRRFVMEDGGVRYPILFHALRGAGHRRFESEMRLNEYVQPLFSALPTLPYWDARARKIVPCLESLGDFQAFQKDRQQWLKGKRCENLSFNCLVNDGLISPDFRAPEAVQTWAAATGIDWHAFGSG